MRANPRFVVSGAVCLTALCASGFAATVLLSGHLSLAVSDGSVKDPYLDSQPDIGARPDRMLDETTAKRYLTEFVDTGSLPPTLAGTTRATQQAYNDAPHTATQRLHALSEVTTDQIASTIAEANRAGVDEDFGAQQPDWLNYSSARFVTTEMRGTQIHGNTADILIRGHFRYDTLVGTTRENGEQQSHLELRRDSSAPTGWKVTKETAGFLPDEGP